MAAAHPAAPRQALTLHDHIKEFRNRLFVVAIVFILVSAVAYNFKDTLIYWLLRPLGGEQLIYLNPAGGFSFIFQVTMYVGLAASVPVLIYNCYRFVAPALPERVQKYSLAVMVASLLLLAAGVAFGYFLAIPGALNFLNHFADGYVAPSLTADSYMNFILVYTAGLGVLFQTPLILLLIHWVTPLKPGGLLKAERFIIPIAFIVAALITPTPDAMNQLIIAVPIIVLYQVGVIAVWLSIAREKRRLAREAKRRVKTQRKVEVDRPRAVATPLVATAPQVPRAAALRQPVSVDGFRKAAPAAVSTPASSVVRALPVQPRSPGRPRRSVDGMRAAPVTTARRQLTPHPERNARPQVRYGRSAPALSIDGVSVL